MGGQDFALEAGLNQPRQVADMVDMSMGEQHIVNGRRGHRPIVHGHGPIVPLHGAAIDEDIESLSLHQMARPRFL